MTKQIRTILIAILAMLALNSPAAAQLAVGDKAPVFTTKAAMAGTEFGYSLAMALRKGPVVLYFYPKAFTHGCTLEANQFADAMPDFKAAGATVMGLSNDNIETLKRFSREECRDAFPVGVASDGLISDYQVGSEGSRLASRVSFVISQDGRVHYVYASADYRAHVRQTLASVRGLAKSAAK
ncbi:MAG: peroxiredoxin [Pseudomonadota bacterium]